MVTREASDRTPLVLSYLLYFWLAEARIGRGAAEMADAIYETSYSSVKEAGENTKPYIQFRTFRTESRKGGPRIYETLYSVS